MEFVQKIEFVLNYEQIIRMIKLKETEGIRVTLGVTETAEIVMRCDGMKIDPQTKQIISMSMPENPCPVPPGCPDDPECAEKITALFPAGVSSEALLNYDSIHTMFPDL